MVACGVVIAIQLLTGWLLLRASRITIPASSDDALEVIWITPRTPSSAVPMPDVAVVVRRAVDRPLTIASVVEPAQTTSAPITAEVSTDLSAVLIEQGRQWAAAQAPISFSPPDVLAARIVRVPGQDANRFRMRQAITPHLIASSIGRLFGGPDYTTDPCPLIRGNIAALATNGSSGLLQEELRRDRSYCQP